MAIYMWRDDWSWSPWANTILYLPLESDVVDMSGKTWRTFTTSWISYTNVWWVDSIHVWATWWISLTAPSPLVTTASSEQTISFWVYFADWVINKRRNIFAFTIENETCVMISLLENTSNMRFYWQSWWDWWAYNVLEAWTRKHIVCTNSSAWANVYVNWVLDSTYTWSSTPRGIWGSNTEQAQNIGNGRDWLQYSDWLRGNMRELILEDRVWTAQEVSDYYDLTKADYWIS